MRRLVRYVVPAALVLLAGEAHASNVTEVPDNGSEQMARGGAWVARASDPLATAFNPAGLAGQPTRVTIQANAFLEHTCFTRLRAANDTTADTSLVDASGHYPQACNDVEPAINPQIGATIRLSPKLGLGLLVIGPSTGGNKSFPEFANDATGEPRAAPGRYLLIKEGGLILFPTVGVGYEVVDGLRIGASVAWGVAQIKLASASLALNADSTNPANGDVRANLQVHDYFIPQVNVGAIWSPTSRIDVAAWYRWTDAIKATGDVGTAANFYTKQNAQGDDKNVRYGDTIFEDCGTGTSTKACGSGNNASVKLTVPMEAKIGIRYHKPRAETVQADVPVAPNPQAATRDPVANDVFDIEADLTWANDSAASLIEVRFPGDDKGQGILPVAGISGGQIPPNADQYRNYSDVFGVRVGGDYVVMPDRFALRAGAFFESGAVDPKYQSTDFDASARFGLAGGATYRIKLGSGESTRALEIMAGFEHVFFADMKREDANADGIRGLAGTACNKSDVQSPSTCTDGNPTYRTKWPVNLGTITNAMNIINLGVAYRF